MSSVDQLQKTYEQAEKRAAELQAKKDALAEQLLNVRGKLRDANEKARAAQKAVCDAEAARALLDRPDGESLARSLGLELPE